MEHSHSFNGLYFNNATDHVTLCVFGILISVYALYVEVKKSRDPKYVALCDIGDNMSCSRVLTSEYSKGFGFVHYLVGKDSMLNMPNCILGIIFYSIQLMTGLLPYTWTYDLLYYLSIISCIGSIYLAYVLLVILKDICLVCMATYCVNAALMYLNYQRFIYKDII